MSREGVVSGSVAATERLRLKVFHGTAWSTIASTAVMALLELWLRGPFALQTLAFVTTTFLFGLLAIFVRRGGSVPVASTAGFAMHFAAFAVIERLSPVHTEGIRVVMFALPIGLILLSSVRWAVFFWLAACVDAFLSLRLPDERLEAGLLILNAVGACCVGGIITTVVGIFDRQRVLAQALAQERERDLLEAVHVAEKAAETRTQFLANMSHEIRTPMNGVLGLSRLLVEECTEDGQRLLAKTIFQSGHGLLRILDDILDVSKLDAGALEIDPMPTQVSTLLSEVQMLMAPKAQESGLELDCSCEASVPEWVEVDGHRVRQILTNLIGNAIKFSPEGCVTVRFSYLDDQLVGEVVDRGIGMSPETVGRLFTEFTQADASTARQYGGTGLGLAICRMLCEVMGGSIVADSELGAGSTFRFRLRAPACAPLTTEKGSGLSLGRSLKVLVAEDNPVNQMVARRFLERLGAIPTIVDNGEVAVEAAASQDFDLVLMDLQMPEVDGLQATRRVRALAGDRGRVPIFALTASVMASQRQECLDVGMDDVLRKPIDLESLAARLALLETELSSATPER